jgi:hypothetical protein
LSGLPYSPGLSIRQANTNTGVTNQLQLYNSYRTGVGHLNLTGVEQMRIIEIAVKLRF